jgi:hypothetical protein
MFKSATVRKALILLSMGGVTFAWGGFLGGFDRDFSSCVSNRDLVGFYQTIGAQGIAAVEDSTAAGVFGQGSDFENIVLLPAATLETAVWNNWVAQQFPLDTGVSANWAQ